ncbi:MAG: MATE family efflux transporter [Methylocella sp.]
MPIARQKSFVEGPIIRSLLVLAIPIILANILQAGYQLTDAFWVGRLGAAAVAAVSVSFPITFLMIAMGAGLAVAGSTLIAQYAGARNDAMVNHIAGQTLLMVAAASIVLGGIGYGLAPYLLKLVGVEPDVYAGALGFLRVSFIGLIFVFEFAMFQAIMRGVGETAVPLYIVFGTVVLNFLLDPLFIFGWGPVPGSGVMGAALATLVTQGLATLLALVILRRGAYRIRLPWASLRPDFAYIERAFLLGFPASIELSTRALGLMIMSFLISSFGTLTLAAYGVGSTILQVITIPALGLSMAISTLVGQNIGANNIERASRISILGAALGFGVLTAAGIFAFAFASPLVAFFVPRDADVIAEGAAFIRTMALSWGLIGVQLCLVATLRASGNMLAAMMIALVSQWVVQFPLAYVLSKHSALAARGLWWSFPVTNLVVAFIAICWFAKGDWKKTRLTAEKQETSKNA